MMGPGRRIAPFDAPRRAGRGSTRRPFERPPKYRRPVTLRDLVFVGLVFVVTTFGMIVFVAPLILQQSRDAAILKARGVSVPAEALSTWSEPNGHSTLHRVRVRFRLAGGLQTQVDDLEIGEREAGRLHIPSCMPIVYDPQRPSLAAIDFGGVVRRRHPWLEAAGWIALLVVIMAAAWAGWVLCVRDLLREGAARRQQIDLKAARRRAGRDKRRIERKERG